MGDSQSSGPGSRPESHAVVRAGGTLDSPIMLILAFAAAMAGFCIEETHLFRARPTLEKINMMGVIYTDASSRTRSVAEMFELRGVMGTFGGILGFLMGLAGGLSARSRRAGMFAAAFGLGAGAVAGCVAVTIAVPIYERAEATSAGDLTRSILLHLALWTPLGAAAGVAHGLGSRGGRPLVRLAACEGAAAAAGLVGAALGTVGYDLIGAFCFPLAETGKPLAAEPIPRLLGFTIVALGTAAVVALSARQPPAPAAPKL